MPIQTLLTGFGPFGSVANNPTERLVRHFANETVSGLAIATCALPTSFARSKGAFRAALDAGGRNGQPFEIVLMLGVAAGSAGWRVETQGLNWDAPAIPDVDGFCPSGGKIVADGSAHLPIKLPPQAMLSAIEAIGLPVTLSDSAGQYLCNHLLYTALHLAQTRRLPLRAGFLHVPADEHTFASGGAAFANSRVFSFNQHIAAVRAVLEACASLPS